MARRRVPGREDVQGEWPLDESIHQTFRARSGLEIRPHCDGEVSARIVSVLLLLVGKDTQLPDYVVLISTLGGIALFGFNGFVVGPVVAGLFVASWEQCASAQARLGE